MPAREPATQLVLAGITDSGVPIVDRVACDGTATNLFTAATTTTTTATSSLAEQLESSKQFTAEKEISPERDVKSQQQQQQQQQEHPGGGSSNLKTASLGGRAVTPEGMVHVTTTMQQRSSCTVSGSSGGQQQQQEFEKLIASSGQFDRQRTASLAAALLAAEHAPDYKTFVHFVSPSDDAARKLIKATGTEEEEQEQEEQEPSAEAVISRLLATLSSLKMNNPERHAAAVRRLQDLEEELRVAGAMCPPDKRVSDAITEALASAASPNTDIQIRVNSSRHSTTTKSVFETETPGMEGLDPQTVQRLQQQLISNMSQIRSFPSICSSFSMLSN